MAKKEKIEVAEIKEVELMGETELEHLHALFAELQARGIRSIGDLENQIAKLQK